ncbi:MAG: hypothetical protein GY854_15305 [Deltaproteobacteria bacterium]|nr:hypothetical protein [Deltaproteobacteria bacterium]
MDEKTDPPVTVQNRIDQMVSGPRFHRFEKPGAVRWTLELAKPITFIRWSPLAGLVVSVGDEVHNVTSQGNDRWRTIGGRHHRLFELDTTEILWSPDFNKLSQLIRRGRQGWSRKWNGKLVSDRRGGIYLLDASTVAAIGSDGRDRWRASLEGVRKLEGPFPCKDGALFHGMSGLQRVAVHITRRGSIMSETALGRGAVLISSGSMCQPLVWLGDEIAMLDVHGNTLWKRPSSQLPFAHRLDGGFALVSANASGMSHLEVLTDDGRVLQSGELPISGRLTDVRILPRPGGLSVDAIGACLDVTSPCSKPKGTRGPFNALVSAVPGVGFRAMLRHVQGHLNFASYPEGGILVAGSQAAMETDLTLRDAGHSILWQVALPGRLSSGPYVGPSGEVYVATCRGWNCEAPYLLVSITGRAPPPKKN